MDERRGTESAWRRTQASANQVCIPPWRGGRPSDQYYRKHLLGTFEECQCETFKIEYMKLKGGISGKSQLHNLFTLQSSSLDMSAMNLGDNV